MAKVLIAHPTGNMNVRQNALALAEVGMLAEFWTCLNFDVSAFPWNRFPVSFKQKLGRRSFDLKSEVQIRTSPWREMGRHMMSATGLSWGLEPVTGVLSVDAVYRALDRKVAKRLCQKNGVEMVFASEDGALETFKAAKKLGKRCVYELPIGYWKAAREVLEFEAERLPEWAITITGNSDPAAKLKRKDDELALADAVLVASRFTKETLAKAPVCPTNVLVLPYAAEVSESEEGLRAALGKGLLQRDEEALKPRKLRVLYVGSLTQRKGLSYLFEAMEQLAGGAELTMIGRPARSGCRPLEAALMRHRWIPSLPHAGILEEMRRHDVLVLPSLFEGFGLVLVEALSQGLPIIATNHTGAPDIIEDGREGFIVPIRSSESIAEKLERLQQDPERLEKMRMNARMTAANLLWSDYRQRLAAWVGAVMES